ncbi:2-hydroxyacid dehydrogenase [Mycoplasmopsis gallinacea]|uniref:Lactate dehydrogenase n=1 Tax=Mycoplasmopsis gallinacea TaxID=29556 RepID=A0A6H0V1I0_9BACT|nr:2-hydroxyacid dehydrogenase [Mycoplasmopsis gallinacea]QIW62191.1 lactate dehydrogenase [Mycoplasmopsis gallinacea]
MKVICFGVRDVEKPIFEKYNKNYNYDLELRRESLSADNVDCVKGFDAIIARASDKINCDVLEKVKEFGIKYVLTRTVGFDHMDVSKGKELGILMARVPSYSPTAISEVAVSMAQSLSRKTAHFAYNASKHNFQIDPFGFAKEMKNSVVAIIGTGKIGYESAKMFKGLGAKVLGYDPYPNEKAKEVLEYASLDEVLAQADIVSFHMPYIKGVNDKMINKDLLSKMKDGSILINSARGQIQDESAILEALESGKLSGAGLDVLYEEKLYFGKNQPEIKDEVILKLLSMYPRVLVSPHIGSYTDEAVANMVEISYENLKNFVESGDCPNKL